MTDELKDEVMETLGNMLIFQRKYIDEVIDTLEMIKIDLLNKDQPYAEGKVVRALQILRQEDVDE